MIAHESNDEHVADDARPRRQPSEAYTELHDLARAYVQRTRELETENARLRGALEPFAKVAEGIPDNWLEGVSLCWHQCSVLRHWYLSYEVLGQKAGPTVGEYRHAGEAMAGRERGDK